MAKCNGRTKAGKPCKSAAIKGTSKCLFHSKTKSVNWMKSRKMRKDQARK